MRVLVEIMSRDDSQWVGECVWVGWLVGWLTKQIWNYGFDPSLFLGVTPGKGVTEEIGIKKFNHATRHNSILEDDPAWDKRGTQ